MGLPEEIYHCDDTVYTQRAGALLTAQQVMGGLCLHPFSGRFIISKSMSCICPPTWVVQGSLLCPEAQKPLGATEPLDGK